MDADGDGHADGYGHGHGFSGHDADAFGHDHDAYGHADHEGAGQATYDALGVAYSHAPDHHSGSSQHCATSQSGAAHETHSHASEGHGGHIHKRNRCDVPPNMAQGSERRVYVCHVVGHGAVDVMAAFAEIARKYDVIRLDKFRPTTVSVDERLSVLADDEPWNPPYDLTKDPPHGWYPGATGTTHLRRQTWQVGLRKTVWNQGLAWALRQLRKHDWNSPPEYDPTAKTSFDVGCATWRYAETGDYETLFTININSMLIWHPRLGVYGYKKIPFQAHQAAAEKMIMEVLEVLKKAVPTEEARRLRAYYTRKLENKAPQPKAPGEGDKKKPLPQPPPKDGDNAEPAPQPGAECVVDTTGSVEASGADLDRMLADAVAEDSSKTALPPVRRVNVVVALPHR